MSNFGGSFTVSELGNEQWWEKYADEFELTSSVAAIDELQQGTSQYTKDRIALLKNATLLEINKDIIEVTQIYIDHLIMPNDLKGDALHLALACYYKVDVLLTWNCQPIANANKFDHIRRINFQIGLPTPILATPLNYLAEQE